MAAPRLFYEPPLANAGEVDHPSYIRVRLCAGVAQGYGVALRTPNRRELRQVLACSEEDVNIIQVRWRCCKSMGLASVWVGCTKMGTVSLGSMLLMMIGRIPSDMVCQLVVFVRTDSGDDVARLCYRGPGC